jgi:hypothetical protein
MSQAPDPDTVASARARFCPYRIEERLGAFSCYTLFETDPLLERLRGSPRFRTFLTALRKKWGHIPGEAD